MEDDTHEDDPIDLLRDTTTCGIWLRRSTASSHSLRKSIRLPCAAYSNIMHRGSPKCNKRYRHM